MAHMHPPIPPAHPHPPHPGHHPAQGEELPSYEDMIVEALMDVTDPDGAAPRELFTRMEARWPLQSNFRPSASQALQKAFKRGRLEKTPSGKYRLNPAWEGGATSRRTTRRPQTVNQATYNAHGAGQPSSPFTNAPLPARSRGGSAVPQPAAPAASGQHTPYGGYPYSYPYSYPGYTQPQGQISGKTTATTSTAAANTSSTAGKTTVDAAQASKDAQEASAGGDSSADVWEAAQHILKAINFNFDAAATEPDATSTAEPVAGPSTMDSNAPPADGSSTTQSQTTILSDEHRSALQAQLALLAAQLTEMSEMDEDEEPEAAASLPSTSLTVAPAPTPAAPSAPRTFAEAVAASLPPPPTSSTLPPPPPSSDRPVTSHNMQTMLDVNQFPEDSHLLPPSSVPLASASSSSSSSISQPEPPHPPPITAADDSLMTIPQEGVDDDSDDDMDMVEVEVPVMAALHA
ncbi:hypothetical protein K474DRAFT_112493 [Panus rudis PR-1116 ss-1]|nr:hypothetical protein K474DRAFT_112493 [Panus rudis PR-1116 ss-1]